MQPSFLIHPMVRFAQIAATIAAFTAVGTGVVVFLSLRSYREPDPGPGNMGSIIPFAFLGMTIGVVVVISAVPQLACLVSVWLGRPRAFLISAVLCVLQGALPLLTSIVQLRSGRIEWLAALYGGLQIACGILLIVAGKYFPYAGIESST